jgi:ABC-type dipeptide/oligopeptide/nickel transport system permease component
MFKYFQTTTLILFWCFFISWLWAVVVYWYTTKFSKQSIEKQGRLALLPALVLAPLALVLFHSFFGINLLFPLHFFASFSTLLLASLVPAVVLLLASGLLGSIKQTVAYEYSYWRGKTFALVSESLGRRVDTTLRRLVLLKALTASWSRCLPWLFGELIVVESVFNAPGLGLDAWHLARIRDFAGLAEAIFWLALLYGICVAVTAVINNWIGKRLESYS